MVARLQVRGRTADQSDLEDETKNSLTYVGMMIFVLRPFNEAEQNMIRASQMFFRERCVNNQPLSADGVILKTLIIERSISASETNAFTDRQTNRQTDRQT